MLFLKTDRKLFGGAHPECVSSKLHLRAQQLHYMWKMTEIKQVNVSVRSLSFYFFFSLPKGGCWNRVGAGKRGTFDGHYVITLKPNGLRQIDILSFDSYKWGHQIRAIKKEGGWAGWGGGLYCYIIQCRFMSNTTNTSTQYMIHEEKERERMGIELNEQREKMNITQLCWVLLCFCEDSALVSIFLSERVRVTVRAGASLSLSLASERLAKGNYQLTDQQAGLGRLVIGWRVQRSEGHVLVAGGG